ncbi:TonB-dependent receptor [Echinicola vietnamensis]|uniref:TonB-dependent receptor n=1 Tax=Echinicola vietnamensis (strain DSM 17526 / LMG 23754 / KMM 6221) TaxID=926556 RepID=L0G779_ECHVK|nr:TonB-dependent receptor [Echinicola vietnamensis]AGA80710.1 TonB-dependent receptor [Echinicola vietnamensis DSM 17526]
MKNLLLKTLTLMAFCCLGQEALFAQGVLRGRVIDAQNLSMPGANVVLQNTRLGTVTNQAGDYAIVDLPEGEYEVSVSYLGYGSVVHTATVEDGETTILNFKLDQKTIENLEFVVMGDRLKGQAKALSQQKNNPNITNIVSSDQIGRFPDANIGDALKRIPGITMQNDQGEARDIIIRGMAPQLNSVTLNGERIPSAEGDNRRVQMDLIPSDMIQTIEVNKAVLPNMDADAIGGSVNLVTRQAPNNLRISGTAASGINLLSDKPIWTGAMIVGNRFLNDKLGAIVSASYNNHNFGSENIESVWYESDNGVGLEEFEMRKYLVQRVRRSVSLALDYEINPNHTLLFSSMYNHRDDWENRFAMKVDNLDDVFDDGNYEERSPGVFTSSGARVEYETKGGQVAGRNKQPRRLEDQRVKNFTLGGDHLFNKLKMDWSATYAKASEERPHERYITFREEDQNVNIDITNPRKPYAALTNLSDNLGFGLDNLSDEYQYTFDEDLNAKLDFKLPYSDKGIVQFGGRYRGKYKNRNNNYFEYSPLDEDAFGTTLGDMPYTDQSDPDFLPGSQYLIGNFADPDFLGNLELNDPSLFERESVLEEFLPGNYSANETITAAYAMADHQFTEKLSAIVGLRWEHTSIDYTGNLYDVDNETFTQATQDDSYSNFMPGVHLKYDADPNTILRFAWTNTIARPNYYDLVPYAEYVAEDDELSRGNPDLLPTVSMNFDLMAEKYFDNVGLISLGGFYKDIDQFVYEKTDLNYNDPVFGDNLEYTRPENGGTAAVYGLEASIQKQIWKGLGIYLNYTLTQSETTGIEGREEDDLELPGTAQHMFNASLSYETKKLVFRASLNYAGDYLDELGGSQFEDRYYDEQMFLDINASYAFTPKWRLFVEGNNLTNQPLRYYQGIRARTMQEEYYNARFNFGIKFDLFE